MTTEHPITPPPKLVWQWHDEWMDSDESGVFMEKLATQAARWGADQELEACIEWLWKHQYDIASVRIRAARRPKPPSLAEQALEEIQQMEGAMYSADLGCDFTATRAALERLQELEKGNE